MTPPTDVSTVGEFEEALTNSDRIRLTSDLTFTEGYELTSDLELDLDGHAITSNLNSDPQFTVNGGKLTLKGDGSITTKWYTVKVTNGEAVVENGTYFANASVFKVDGSNAKLTINDGSISVLTGNAISAANGATVEINGGTIETTMSAAVSTGSSGTGGCVITVNGGTLIGNMPEGDSEACAVVLYGNDTFVLNDGEIRGEDGAGICIRGGHAIINGGSITSTGEPGSTGYIGTYLDEKRGKSAIIYDKAAGYPYASSISLTVTGGTITGVDHSIDVLSDEVSPNVTVTGGTFDPVYPEG